MPLKEKLEQLTLTLETRGWAHVPGPRGHQRLVRKQKEELAEFRSWSSLGFHRMASGAQHQLA